MDNRFDLLIAGAGPAGSFAAERLARAGFRVALFDGRPPDEPKACGGGVTSKALKAWPHLLDGTARIIRDLDMYAPGGERLSMRLAEPFAIYSRRAFDSLLRERARAAGAHVVQARVSFRKRENEREPWSLTAAGREWKGTHLVAADGASSRIARSLAGPLPPAEMEVAFGYRAPLPETGGAPAAVAFLPRWAGYAWAFPRPDHVSFGIATSQDAFDHAALDDLLWDFMAGYYRQRTEPKINIWKSRLHDAGVHTALREWLGRTSERYAARIPGLAPETWDNRKTAGNGWTLIGDAAGFADPVTGEGIFYALRSAELFADAYTAGDAQSYERLWREDFGRELRRAAEMRRRFYGNFWGAPFTQRMIEFARAHPGIRSVLGELVAGDQGYLDLKRVLARRAVWPF